MHISFYKRPLLAALALYAVALALFMPLPSPTAKDITFQTPREVKNAKGVVADYPRQRQNDLLFTLEMQTADGAPAYGRVFAVCKDCPALERAQAVTFDGRLDALERQENFGSFDFAKYLARKHIFTSAQITSVNKIENTSQFWHAVSSLRESILQTFKNNFNADLLPIISGITLGEKSDLNDELRRAFQDSGAMHLLVASGGNVGFVTLIVYFLCSLLGLRRVPRALWALGFALLYTLIAGADAPLTRAYIMTLAATTGFILGRKSGVLQGLVLAALALLIYNPQNLFEAGFQMSFLATYAIILTACNYNAAVSRKLPKALRFIIQLFLISLSAQAALLPLFTNYFYKISFAAVFSNILLVPLSGLLMGGGFLLWLLSFVPSVFVFNSFAFILTQLLLLFKALVEFFAATTISNIPCGALSVWSISFYYAALVCLLNLPLFKRKSRKICAVFVVVFCALFLFSLKNNEGEKIHFLKGKYGGAVLFKQKEGISVIGASINGQTLKNAVFASGSAKIKCLFLSGVTKSAAYALNDMDGIEIENIYIPYGPREDLAPILDKTKSAITSVWAGKEYCGAKAQRAWFLNKNGEISESYSPDIISYALDGVSTAGNLKACKKDGQIYQLN